MGTFSRIIPGRMNRRGMGLANAVVATPFNGNFASLFPGAFQVVQSDLGLTYGGTPLAAGTTPVVGTITGTLATTPVPILFTCTTPGVIGAGAIFAASFNDGISNAMTGINPAAGTPFALTGAATGLSMAWAAGSALVDNTWTATCVGLADQSGNLKHYSQATASKQPLLTVGLNSKPGLDFDGVSRFMNSAVNLAAPATTNVSLYTVFTPRAKGAQQNYFGSASAVTLFSGSGALNSLTQYCGTNGNGSAALTSAPTRIRATYTGSISDLLKVGAAVDVTGASAGNGVSTGFNLASGTNTGLLFAAETVYLLVLCPAMSPAQLAAVDAAVNSVAGYGVGSVLV